MAKGAHGPGAWAARLESQGTDFFADWAGKTPPASSGGNARGSSWPSGNPADASGAFRPNPRASTEVVKPFFQTAKLIHLDDPGRLSIFRERELSAAARASFQRYFFGGMIGSNR